MYTARRWDSIAQRLQLKIKQEKCVNRGRNVRRRSRKSAENDWIKHGTLQKHLLLLEFFSSCKEADANAREFCRGEENELEMNKQQTINNRPTIYMLT